MSRGSADARGSLSHALDAEAAAAIFEAASLLVVILDRDARILRFNAACERATGFRADELLGQTVWRLIPDDQLADVEVVFRELRDTGRSNLHENDWNTKTRGRRRIAWSNVAVRDASGAVVRVIGTGIDVTELRASEAQRSESDARLVSIVHSAMDAIVTVDEAQRVVLFNPAAAKMFGRASAEVVGRPLDLLIPERFRGAHPEHMNRFARSGQTSRRMGQLGHVWGLRANGEEFPVEASISQVRSRAGALLTVILRDVTDRERATATTALLASIVRSSDDAIIATDRDGRILTWNPAAQEIYGYPRHEAEGGRLAMLIPPEIRPELDSLLARVHHGRSIGHLETIGLRKDGRRFDVSLGISPRRNGSGAIAGASVVARDISEHRDLERRLHQTEELASVATLITGIAHDIGTPMNVILGYTGMLARSLSAEKDRERLRIIREQVERVVRLIQTLMNFARPQQPEAASFARVEEILERSLRLITETARHRRIAIERDFAETAPIRAKGDRLERAFLNLLVNACDAMTEGGVLRVATTELENAVEIRIEDTGAGIDPATLERIFEPFYSTKAPGRGSGIGLLVTRGIILEHLGAIDVRSELGKGTAFRIRLPREPAAAVGGSELAP
jgi:protein-histidine pros-kinase